jgi:O-antigen/teichoic acid export membrane protein
LNPLKKLAGQTVIYGLSSIVPRFLNYLLVPFYTRIFIPSEYGVITELYAYVTFFIIILTYGMETGFFRFSEMDYDNEKVYSTSLISLLVTSILFILVIFLFANPIAASIGYGQHTVYIKWLGLILALDAVSAIPFARLRSENRAVTFSTIKIISVIVNIGANFFFLLICPLLIRHGYTFFKSFYNPELGVGYVLISNLIASAITLLILLPRVFRFRFVFDTVLWKKMIIYSLPLLIAGLAGTVNESLDRVVLKHLVPDSTNAMRQLGLYGANVKVAVLMTLFIQMFRFAAEPFFFNHSKDHDSRSLFAQTTKYFSIFGLIIFLGVMLYMDLVKYFIGVDYRSALGIVPVLLMANFFLGIFYNLSIWYKLTNRTIYGAYITLIGAGITVLFNFVFVPHYGYYAAAYAHLVCYVVMVLISYFVGQKYYPVKYDVSSFLFYFTVAILIFSISKFIPVDNLKMRLSINSLLFISFIFIIFKKENLKMSDFNLKR